MHELHLYGPIGNVSDSEGITAESFSQTLSEIDPAEPLDLFISSPGGVVRDGLTMYSELVRRPGPVNVHVQGVVGSIASVIAMAGDTITIAESARYMIHNPMGPSAIAFGEADTLRQAAEETLKVADVLDGMRDATADVYAARTGTDREQILEWMAAETWFNSEESMRHGFADKIASNKRMVAMTKADEIQAENAAPFAEPIATASELEEVQELLKTLPHVLPPTRSVAASKDLFRLAERKLRLTAE